MRIAFKMNRSLLEKARENLARPHPFAAERVGFFSCKVGALKPHGWVVLAHEFYPVADNDYVEDHTVGAMMGPSAIRKALQIAFDNSACMFHVHVHNHRGQPRFSHIDLSETAAFVPDFWHVCPNLVHGAVVLSVDSMVGRCWHPRERNPLPVSEFSVVGWPTWLHRSG